MQARSWGQEPYFFQHSVSIPAPYCWEGHRSKMQLFVVAAATAARFTNLIHTHTPHFFLNASCRHLGSALAVPGIGAIFWTVLLQPLTVQIPSPSSWPWLCATKNNRSRSPSHSSSFWQSSSRFCSQHLVHNQTPCPHSSEARWFVLLKHKKKRPFLSPLTSTRNSAFHQAPTTTVARLILRRPSQSTTTPHSLTHSLSQSVR